MCYLKYTTCLVKNILPPISLRPEIRVKLLPELASYPRRVNSTFVADKLGHKHRSLMAMTTRIKQKNLTQLTSISRMNMTQQSQEFNIPN